jgi:predicted Holliday junction resolvase-like endonuclease
MSPVTAFLLGLAVGGLLLVVLLIREKLRQQGELARARKQSVQQSRSTLKGQMAEQMAPLLPGFDYTPADAKFLGDPIDYVVFQGLTDARDGDGSYTDLEVVLIDVKYGKSKLSEAQRAIAEAIEAGRVRFEVVRIDAAHKVTKSHFTRRKNAARD